MLYRLSSRLCFATVFVAGLTLLAGFPAAAQEPDAKIVYKQTASKEGEEVLLHLHVFKPEGWTEDDARPTIVFFFGGGWVQGSPAQFYPHCELLAKHGMVAMAAEYRVLHKHGTPPQECVRDGKSAIRYVRMHAEQLGIDPNKVAAGGGSAGGHVAATTGLVKGFEERGEDLSVSSRPDLMVLFNPVIDTSPKTGWGAGRLGSDAKKLSPLHNVHADQPPTIIFHGDADTTVPISHVRRFNRACEKVDAQCELKEYKGAPHGFFNLKKPETPDDPANRFFYQTTQAMLVFLVEHGFIGDDQ